MKRRRLHRGKDDSESCDGESEHVCHMTLLFICQGCFYRPHLYMRVSVRDDLKWGHCKLGIWRHVTSVDDVGEQARNRIECVSDTASTHLSVWPWTSFATLSSTLNNRNNSICVMECKAHELRVSTSDCMYIYGYLETHLSFNFYL